MDVIRTLLLLKNIPNFGCIKINKIFNKLDNIQDIFGLSKIDLLNIGLAEYQVKYILNPDWYFVDKQQQIANKNNIEIIDVKSKSYPGLLKQIYDPPVVIYCKGNKSSFDSQLFSIVGTRKPTIYGRQMTEHFSSELLGYGYSIVSGFALGVDIISHLTCINHQRPTVAVLGTSLDYIYPAGHKKYVNKVLDAGGLLVSENSFTTAPHPSCFPRRNRIISGLSRGVLVVEAARKSGSLITARCAMEQSREVFAVPGNINNPQALGCLDLIACGAKLVMTIDDIIEELSGISLRPRSGQPGQPGQPSQPKRFSSPQSDLFTINADKLSKQQSCLVQTILGAGVVQFDNIVNNSHLTAEEVASNLVQLEIMGYVEQVAGGYVSSKNVLSN